MSQVSFDEFERSQDMRTTAGFNGDSPRVSYFSLKNDGDEAIVRIMHDSTRDFDIVNTHRVTIDGRPRAVGCNRDSREDLSKCPLCSAGVPVNKRMYIHLIEYVRDENGKITPMLKVWERAASYAYIIRDYINDYGPLSECLLKIRRQGAAGSRDTSYNITYCRPEVYKNEVYPKVPGAFDNYKAEGNAVLSKTYEELEALASSVAKPGSTTSSSTIGAVGGKPEPVTPVYNTPQDRSPIAQAPTSTDNIPPWGNPLRSPAAAPVNMSASGAHPRRTF